MVRGPLMDTTLPAELHFEAVMGFLPPVVPRFLFPSPLSRFAEAAGELASHYHRAEVRPWLDSALGSLEDPDSLREAIDALDVAGLSGLSTTLGVLAHAYRWGSAPPSPSAYHLTRVDLPRALDVAWTHLATLLGIPRVGNLHAMVLCNWRFRDSTPRSVYVPSELDDTLDLGISWLLPPERDELHAFVMTALLTEAAGVKAIHTALGLVSAARDRDIIRTRFLFDRLEDEIDAMARPFRLLIQKKRLRPDSFLMLVQPTTIWGLDEGDGPLEGASGPQVGSLQVIDALLGVPRSGPMAQAILHSRKYLLPSQRSFLEAFEREAPAVLELVDASGDPMLRARHAGCVEVLRGWRQMHQKRGALYLRGESSTLPYTSTGGVVALADERVRVFEHHMATRIAETDLAQRQGLATDRPTALLALTHLDPHDASTIEALGVRQTFAAGSSFARAGTRRAGLWIVLSGSVHLERDEAEGPRIGARYGRAGLLGVSAFMTGAALEDHLVCDDPCELLHLPAEGLFRACEADPRFALRLFQSLGAHLTRELERVTRHFDSARPPLVLPTHARALALRAEASLTRAVNDGGRVLVALHEPLEVESWSSIPLLFLMPDAVSAASVRARLGRMVDWGDPFERLESIHSARLDVAAMVLGLGTTALDDHTLASWLRLAGRIVRPGGTLTVASTGPRGPSELQALVTDPWTGVAIEALEDLAILRARRLA